MSSDAADERSQAAVPPEWARLELAVRRMLDGYESWRRRAHTAEARVQELERTLHDVVAGDVDPRALAARLQAVERENGVLQHRLEQARDRVHHMLARLDVLEDES